MPALQFITPVYRVFYCIRRNSFYPRDALLAQVLAMTLCPCLSVCHKSVFCQWMGGLICFLTWSLLLVSPTLCFKEIHVSRKIRVLTLELFPDLENFATAYRCRTCYQFSSRKMATIRVINCTVVCQLS